MLWGLRAAHVPTYPLRAAKDICNRSPNALNANTRSLPTRTRPALPCAHTHAAHAPSPLDSGVVYDDPYDGEDEGGGAGAGGVAGGAPVVLTWTNIHYRVQVLLLGAGAGCWCWGVRGVLVRVLVLGCGCGCC